jgi:phosphopantothenoylcysteine decarboxylase/phosphopantothenate--cysteine ligase
VHIVGPADGPLTGGDSGPGRMSEPEQIAAFALSVVSADGDLADLRVAVSTGGTREPIDPVRFIGNRSSGRQGAAIAVAAADRGAHVRLVAAHVDEGALAEASVHPRIAIIRVGTAGELGSAMREAAVGADAVVMVAAVADYRVAEVADRKLSKEDGPLQTLALVPNDDILAGLVSERAAGQTVVGFAAETPDDEADLLERGRRKRRRKGVDLLAVNEVGWNAGFESSDNRVIVLGADDEVVAEASGTKRAVADAVWDAVAKMRGR